MNPPDPTPSLPGLRRRVRALNQRLVAAFGHREVHPRDPLDGLILIFLSQATTDTNCDRAFTNLRATWPTWEAVRCAHVAEVADAIRSGGLANQKAARISQLLNEIHAASGTLDLNWMHTAPTAQCEAYLNQFHGVGPKTVACVLLFYLAKPAFPVDTHVFRVLKRLGYLRPSAAAKEAHEVMMELVHPDDMLDLHVNLIALGRTLCRATGDGGPYCSPCPVRSLCALGKALSRAQLQEQKVPLATSRDLDFFVTVKARS